MTDEEKEKLEQDFQYALDNIVSKIKGETATAIVVSEQSMILLFKRLMLKIEKQSKEIEELNIKILSNAGIYQLGFNDGEKKVKDKIKAIIEEYEDFGTSIYYGLRSNGKAFHQAVRMEVKEVLQSLLDKE